MDDMVSVKDRLPDEWEEVLALVRNKHTHVTRLQRATHDKNGKWIHGNTPFEDWEVVKWKRTGEE